MQEEEEESFLGRKLEGKDRKACLEKRRPERIGKQA